MIQVQVSQMQGRVPVTVFQLQEHIHLGNVSELEALAKDNCEQGMRDAVIDLSETDTLTSIGLRAIIIIHKLLTKYGSGKHLKIAGASMVMREIMQVTGISQFIDSYDTVDEAVASF